MKERKDRVEDALHATKAAAQEGYVPGGGVAFLRAMDAVTAARNKARGDEKIGYDIVLEALKSPLRQIAANGGYDGDVAVEQAMSKTGGYGFDAAKGEFTDLVKAGIIDRPWSLAPPCSTGPRWPGSCSPPACWSPS